MKVFGIGEIARRTGVPTSTIRYYESVGLLPPATRISGKRRYDVSIVQRIGLIRIAQQAGFALAEIQTLLEDPQTPAESWRMLAGHKLNELNELAKRIDAMKSLVEQTLHCDCQTFDECAALDEATVRLNCGNS